MRTHENRVPVIRQLAPLVFRTFDMTEEFERTRDELMRGADEKYVAWLAALQSAFETPAES